MKNLIVFSMIFILSACGGGKKTYDLSQTNLPSFAVYRNAISRGVDLNTYLSNGITLMHLAASDNNVVALMFLSMHGGKLDQTNSVKTTPLHIAAADGAYDAVEYLLQSGINPNTPDLNNCLPIHLAAMNGKFQCVKLLAPVSDLSVVDLFGNSPAQAARKSGYTEIANYIDSMD